jgi:hypothetical protein
MSHGQPQLLCCKPQHLASNLGSDVVTVKLDPIMTMRLVLMLSVSFKLEAALQSGSQSPPPPSEPHCPLLGSPAIQIQHAS